MNDTELIKLLKFDLQRIGTNMEDEEYLSGLLQAAKSSLARQGIQAVEAYDYTYLVVGTAAWMYRKRINGEAEPAYLKRMRHDMLFSQKMGGGSDAT